MLDNILNDEIPVTQANKLSLFQCDSGYVHLFNHILLCEGSLVRWNNIGILLLIQVKPAEENRRSLKEKAGSVDVDRLSAGPDLSQRLDA